MNTSAPNNTVANDNRSWRHKIAPVLVALLPAGIIAATGESSDGVWPLAIGVAISLALVIAVMRWFPFGGDSRRSDDVPTMALSDAERLVFVEQQTVPWLAAMCAAMAALGVALLFLGPWFIGAIVLGSMIPAVALARVSVQVDHRGLAVRSALLPVRFARIGLDEIEQASVIEVEPMQWGGWGYRGSLKLAGSAAVVTRKGPGMRLDLTRDRRFAVTIDDPDTPTRLLNTLRAGA